MNNSRFGSHLPMAGLLALVAVCATGTTVQVGSCNLGHVQFPTISAAVAASPAGTTIDVCPGQYPEQVVITKNDMTIRGVSVGTEDGAEIVTPSGGVVANTNDVDSGLPIAAQVLVQNATSVSLGDLIIDGSNNGITGCSPDIQGILFQSASGTVNHVTVRNEYPSGSGLGGCQTGEGIFVQTASGSSSTVTVSNSSVHAYQKNGITGNDPNTTLNVTGSRVQGLGVVQPPNAAQNGIQLGFGAEGSITKNFVTDDVYGDTSVAIATGILLYDTNNSGVQVNQNTVANTQGAVVIYTGQDDNSYLGNNATANSNNIFATVNYDAIDVCTNGNTINDNTIFDSSQSAIHLDGSCGSYGNEATGNNNSATGNTITDSGCTGILQDDGTTGNTTSGNTFYAVPNTITDSCSASDPRAASRPKGHYSPKGKK
jgi:hypothetical protein